MSTQKQTKYTKDHEWVRMEGDVAVVGITPYAAEQLGDVVFVELPDIGKAVNAGADMAVVESAKAASDVYAPISGSVEAVNDALSGSPQLVNESADGDGWFVKIKPANAADLDALMDEAAYADYVKGL
ncbi:MAG: glycine cleavage system protein GcvH [Alphaproteobacteria bacterium]|nr:glycine cleavage system protein GcvH [Alphaproteobacteria bacterium]